MNHQQVLEILDRVEDLVHEAEGLFLTLPEELVEQVSFSPLQGELQDLQAEIR